MPPEPFPRLTDLASRGRAEASDEEKLGGLVGRVADPVGLDGPALERVWRRLRQAAVAPERAPWPFQRASRWGLAVVFVLASSAVVGARTGAWTWPQQLVRGWRSGLSGPAPQARRRAAVPERAARVAVRWTPSSEAPVAPSPAPSASPPARSAAAPATDATAGGLPRTTPELAAAAAAPKRVGGSSRLSARAVVPDEASGPLADESRLLGEAVAQLRRGGDPRIALEELDRYAARFPAGALRPEAARARVDALWLAGRAADARAALANLALGAGARDRELRLLRAELNAGSDCGAAFPDFAIVAAEGATSALAERALWGEAVCRDRLGDAAGARASLAAYLRRFPDGPRADQARSRLAGPPRPSGL